MAKNKSLYDETVAVLYDAYFAGTLEHGKCTACAVGNILKATARRIGVSGSAWSAKFVTESPDDHSSGDVQLLAPEGLVIMGSPMGKVVVHPSFTERAAERKQECDLLLEAAPYSVVELRQIEFAFEHAEYGRSKEDHMFNGLEAVLTVLGEIHEMEDDADVKKKFRKHYETIQA